MAGLAEPRHLDVAGKHVVVKLMDDSWIWNECVSAHPFRPRSGIVWSHSDHCARLPVPGDELPDFVRWVCDMYGNCAAMAWHEDLVLGHIVWLPRAVARDRQAAGWQGFGTAEQDEGTLVVVNVGFCSLSGHEFRRQGIGKAFVEIMLEWARENGWRRVEVYDTPTGLLPGDWLDACIPPWPFWEGRGFEVFARHGKGELSAEQVAAILSDDPRLSSEEQLQKREIIAAIRRGEVAPDLVGYSYALRREL